MSKRTVVTKEIILQVYDYRHRFGDKLHNKEIASLVGLAESTVYKIFKGEYDYMLEDKKEEAEEAPKFDSLSTTKQLGNISEQIFKLANNYDGDMQELMDAISEMNKELRSIADLLHIIAVHHMRREPDRNCKSKMADQIQYVHTNKRLSEALK